MARFCNITWGKSTMDEATYQVGFKLGEHWARLDAKPDQLLRLKKLGDGKEWVAFQRDSAKELTSIIDPNKDSFVGTGENPSPSFVAGFIDGAQTIEPSS
jgi:hypothetical protein